MRWRSPPGAAVHLAVGLERLEAARRGGTLFVVSPVSAPVPLLERVDGARHAGATIFALDQGDPDLEGLAHESLIVAAGRAPVSFGAAQHLVSVAAGQRGSPAARRSLCQRLARLLDQISGAP